MKRRSRILLVALAVTICVVVAWRVLIPNDPIYLGERESFWIESLTNGYVAGLDFEQWQALGSNAVPILLKAVKKRHPFGSAGYAAIWRKLPGIVGNWCPKPVDISWRRTHALNILREFADKGPIPAAPILLALKDNDPSVAMGAASCLIRLTSAGGLRQDTRDIVSALTQAFKNNPDAPGEAFHASVRNNIVIALGYCHDQVEVVVPVLQKALQDPNARVREKATNALQRIQAKTPSGVN